MRPRRIPWDLRRIRRDSLTPTWDWELSSGAVTVPQPTQLGLDTVRIDFGRPDANSYGARCGHGTATVPNYRGAGPLLPEGVLPQWLHQEPETTRPLLQRARRVPVPRPVRGVPGRNRGKGELLARARGHGKSRHDSRQARLNGCGGESDRRIPPNPQ